MLAHYKYSDTDPARLRSHTNCPRMPLFLKCRVVYEAIYQIYAVYDRNKRILITLALLFSVNIVTTVLIVFKGPPGGEIMPRWRHHLISYGIPGTLSPSRTLAGCFVVDRASSYLLCWIPAFVFETLLFCMMLFRGWRAHKRGLNSPLFNVVIRDR